jgi:hypothetical protein
MGTPERSIRHRTAFDQALIIEQQLGQLGDIDWQNPVPSKGRGSLL